MCMISRDLYERAKALLPVDTMIRWSIGSANSTMDKVFGVCHSVAGEVGGIEIPVRVFIVEGASQEFLLGRTWDRLARAQHDNRHAGSPYISITSLDERKTVTFSAVADLLTAREIGFPSYVWQRIQVEKKVFARVLATVE